MSSLIVDQTLHSTLPNNKQTWQGTTVSRLRYCVKELKLTCRPPPSAFRRAPIMIPAQNR